MKADSQAEQAGCELHVVVVDDDEVWFHDCVIVATARHLPNGTYRFETPAGMLQWSPDQEKRFKFSVATLGINFLTA